MHRILVVLLALAAVASAGTPPAVDAQTVQAAILSYYGPLAAESKLYVGSEACMVCHRDQAGWKNSLHATGLKTVNTDAFSMKTRKGIIVDYDRNGVEDFKQGLDFNRINSVFDPYKPNAPVLSYANGKGYSIRIGRVDYPVVFTHGGSGFYKQRFIVKIPVTDRPGGLSAGNYYSPIQYNEANYSYVLYEPAYWYNADRSPKFSGPVPAKDVAAGKSFDKGCAGCHSTALVKVGKDANGEWVSQAANVVFAPPDDPHYLDLNGSGNRQHYNIGCERCHGPGSEHIGSRGAKDTILNPAKMEAKEANFLCGSCHSRGASLPAGTHEFPLDERTGEEWKPGAGEELYGRFWSDKPGLYPDGETSRQHHQQLQDFMKSSKWEFAFHKVTCYECHDVHNENPKHLVSQLVVDGAAGKVRIATKVEDNTLCLACHAGFGPFDKLKREDIANYAANRPLIAMVVENHTHHPYEPERTMGLSRCTECHMAKTASSGAPYDMSGHSFHVVPPSKTIQTFRQGGMPNSCAVRCHRPLAPMFGLPADASLATWNEGADYSLADLLQVFYGPDGRWWKTSK